VTFVALGLRERLSRSVFAVTLAPFPVEVFGLTRTWLNYLRLYHNIHLHCAVPKYGGDIHRPSVHHRISRACVLATVPYNLIARRQSPIFYYHIIPPHSPIFLFGLPISFLAFIHLHTETKPEVLVERYQKIKKITSILLQ